MGTYDPKLGLTDLSSEALAEKGENHATMCTGLAWLTLPAGFLTALSAECATLRVLDQEVLFFGGKVKFEAKRVSERKVRAFIKELWGFVTAQADGELQNILDTGFEARSKGAPVENLDMPEGLKTIFTGVTGELEVRWGTVKNAINYKVSINTGDPLKESEWMVVGYTSKARFTVTGQESGKFINVRVQAQGRKGLKSQVSQAVRGLAA
jgi:hypothetical protein